MKHAKGSAREKIRRKPVRVIAGIFLALYVPFFTVLLLTGTPRFLFLPWFYIVVAPLALSALAFSLLFRTGAIVRIAALSALVLALWLTEIFLTTVYYFTRPQIGMPLLEAMDKAGAHMDYTMFVVTPLVLSGLVLILYWDATPEAAK
ncbi:MAG: hypothetical protein CVV05_14170 [Gammaproteobacteria bacterium HGW-Gammaproteobacteria-1]|jgi:hypothetical protein|nr:MAG: hypothetical protein CVV05_14170 [Gammaproteobacteria bacterium HGW-Gammaproteobacteria-1]